MVAITRVANCVGRLLFDPKFQKTLSASLRGSTKAAKKLGNSRFTQFGKQVGDAFIAAEKRTAGNTFFKDMKSLITNFPGDLKTAWQGAKGFKGKAAALWKTTKARAPLLGSGLLVGFEVPNIAKATLGDDGIIGGVVETGKATAKLSGAMLGSCIGTALFPGVGSIIGSIGGFMLGDFLMGKLVGKSYTEKQLAKEEKLLNTLQQSNAILDTTNAQLLNNPLTTDTNGIANTTMPFAGQTTLNQQQLAQLYNSLYGNNKIDLQC